MPPAVEPLYELARLTKDAAGEKQLREAVQRHELTPTSGIREIREIRKATRPTRRSSKRGIAKSTDEGALSSEFVIEADTVLTWDEVEQFKAELTTFVAKFNLRLRGLKNEAAVHGTFLKV